VLETGETILEKLAVYSQKAAQSGCTGLSGGAPDCPVVHRTVSGAPGYVCQLAALGTSSTAYG
jgi:hypothetical protein